MHASVAGVAFVMRFFAFVGASPIALRAINAELTYGASLPVPNSASAVSMSALPPKADMCGARVHVRFGPIADISFARKDARSGHALKSEKAGNARSTIESEAVRLMRK
jgi:hypothetical protein